MVKRNIKTIKLINEIVDNHPSMREFSRMIGQEISAVSRWCSGSSPISIKGTIILCKLYPEIKPYQLNEIFPEDLEFTFKEII